jgi:hypothetical protein
LRDVDYQLAPSDELTLQIGHISRYLFIGRRTMFLKLLSLETRFGGITGTDEQTLWNM